jgi:triosephosphate isomerase
MQRRPFIAGNWKMNTSYSEITALLSDLLNKIMESQHTDIVVFPPYVYLQFVRDFIQRTQSSVLLGAQNLSQYAAGAYTGEIAAKMLKDVNCDYVIVGHSERRSYYHETDEIVAQKVLAALKEGLKPVICIGETKEEREANRTKDIVIKQLSAVITEVGIDALKTCIIAYEPVWAIGTGLTATPAQAQEVHAYLRSAIAQENLEISENIRIIYGGSVNQNNAQELFSMPDIDGGLIGGASLRAEQFAHICQAYPAQLN